MFAFSFTLSLLLATGTFRQLECQPPDTCLSASGVPIPGSSKDCPLPKIKAPSLNTKQSAGLVYLTKQLSQVLSARRKIHSQPLLEYCLCSGIFYWQQPPAQQKIWRRYLFDLDLIDVQEQINLEDSEPSAETYQEIDIEFVTFLSSTTVKIPPKLAVFIPESSLSGITLLEKFIKGFSKYSKRPINFLQSDVQFKAERQAEFVLISMLTFEKAHNWSPPISWSPRKTLAWLVGAPLGTYGVYKAVEAIHNLLKGDGENLTETILPDLNKAPKATKQTTAQLKARELGFLKYFLIIGIVFAVCNMTILATFACKGEHFIKKFNYKTDSTTSDSSNTSGMSRNGN